MIELKNVSFFYRDTTILEEISLSLRAGGFYIIMGPNGGGKTTLLKLIMGLERPTKGSVVVRSTSIGYVPQHLSFDPLFPLTVLECVLMGRLKDLTWYGTYPKAIKEEALELLHSLSILHLKDQPIGSLSGGQRQRTLLARALLCHPDILLLDEPTTGLDKEAFACIQSLLHTWQGKKTILLVTHSFLQMPFDEAICVNKTAKLLQKEHLCQHFAMGVYA